MIDMGDLLQDGPQLFGNDFFQSLDLNVRSQWFAVVVNDSSRPGRLQDRIVHGSLQHDSGQAFGLPWKACSNRKGLLPAWMWLSFHIGLCSDLHRRVWVQESGSGRAGVIDHLAQGGAGWHSGQTREVQVF